jgi:hypothetical protein
VVFEVSLDYIWHMDEFGDAHFSILLGGTLTPTPRLLRQIAGNALIMFLGKSIRQTKIGQMVKLQSKRRLRAVPNA